MKHLKYYNHLIEDVSTQPQINDYVIVKSTYYKPEVRKFLNTNIGQVFSISPKDDDKYQIAFNPPIELRSDFWTKNRNSDNIKYTKWFNLKEIIFFSPNKEDLEQYLLNKKYNL